MVVCHWLMVLMISNALVAELERAVQKERQALALEAPSALALVVLPLILFLAKVLFEW